MQGLINDWGRNQKVFLSKHQKKMKETESLPSLFQYDWIQDVLMILCVNLSSVFFSVEAVPRWNTSIPQVHRRPYHSPSYDPARTKPDLEENLRREAGKFGYDRPSAFFFNLRGTNLMRNPVKLCFNSQNSVSSHKILFQLEF